MKLVTWNVNSLKMRMPRVLELLAEHQPDALCMQETKCEPAAFPAAEFAAAGYDSVHHSAGRWAGVAIAARRGLEVGEVVHGLPGEAAPHEARWIEANIGGVRLCSVYVPNGREVDSPPYLEKLQFFDAMAERLRGVRPNDRTVILGDLNVCPTDLDVYSPAAFAGCTHVTPPERKRFAALLKLRVRDAFRELHPEEAGFTWWDYRAGHFHRGLGLRLDFALLSEPVAAKLVSCGIDRKYRKGEKPSDHAPLIVELQGELRSSARALH